MVRNPTGVSNQLTKEQEPPHAAGSGGPATNLDKPSDATVLLQRSRRLYRLVKDPTLYRWIAILAVLLMDEGKIARDEILQIADQTPLELAQAIKQLAGVHWGVRACKRRWRRSGSTGATSLRTATRNQAEGHRGCSQIAAHSPRFSDPAKSRAMPNSPTRPRSAPTNAAMPPAAAGTASPGEDGHHAEPTLPAHCPKCGWRRFRDVIIHKGQSVRRECERCSWHIGFPVWHGQRTSQRPRHQRS